jgi:hypothetical protein
VTAAAVLGALVPDLSLYLMASWALYVQGIAPEVVFGQLYFSPAWQDVFAVDNSIPLWALLLLAGLALRSPVAVAFAGAGLLHLAFDLPLHNEDARRHFWPLSDWVFRSPFSYWDPRHHGQIVGPIEIAACVTLCVVLWRRFKSRLARVLIALALFAEAMPGLMFAMMMG